MRARKQWANKHQHWSNENWDSTIFSDESSFTLRSTSAHNKLWREASRRFEAANIVPTFKSGYVSLSVWAAFSSRGRTPLIKIEGTLKQKRYKEILKNGLAPFIVKYHESDDNVVF